MALVFSIKDLVEIIQGRIDNKYDANVLVSGARGDGKSTLIVKILSRFKQYRPWKHQVYTRKDVMRLLEGQKRGIIFDDEAINSGYKRDFYDSGQKKLIKMINMYRDNFNIYCSAVPKFYSLDKDLRDLIKIHIHVIRRGIAVIHIARTGNLYSDDVWDIKYNKKIEESWSKKMKKNPNFNPSYHRLTTFIGYLTFGDLSPKQREIYEQIKVIKRKKVYEEELKEQDLDNKADTTKFITECILSGVIKDIDEFKHAVLQRKGKITSVRICVNRRLKDLGHDTTITKMFKENKDKGIQKQEVKKESMFGYTK